MQFETENLLGRTLEEVELYVSDVNKFFPELGLKIRVRRIDEESYIGTCDFNINRVNLQVDKGIITKVSRG